MSPLLYYIKYRNRMLRIDDKQAVRKIKLFLKQLKFSNKLVPFLHKQSMVDRWGFWDMQLVSDMNKQKIITLQTVQRKLINHKYQFLVDFIKQLKQVFQQISDYVFLDDPIQNTINEIFDQIRSFQQKFIRENKFFKKQQLKLYKKVHPIDQTEAGREETKEQALKEMKRCNFAKKIEMVYFFKAHENNQQFITTLCSLYNIGEEINQDYVISLDNLPKDWLDLFSNNNF